MSSPRLVLASSSPRRRELMQEMGLEFEVRTSGVDERAIPADHPRTFALRAAYAKALDVAASCDEGTLVIGADTVVTRSQMLFGKPSDREDARRILRALAAEAHDVITAIVIVKAGANETRLDSETTAVRFHPLNDAAISDYLDRANWQDKAGGYGIQEPEGEALVECIEGDYYNIVGLPCRLLASMLRDVAPDISCRIPKIPGRWQR